MFGKIIGLGFVIYGISNLIDDPSNWFWWVWVGICTLGVFTDGSGDASSGDSWSVSDSSDGGGDGGGD